MTLVVTKWSHSWMVNALACHHEGKGFKSLLWCGWAFKAYKWCTCLKRGLRMAHMPKRALRMAIMHKVRGHIFYGAYLPRFTFLHFINSNNWLKFTNNFLNFYYLINIILMTHHYQLAPMLVLGKIDKPHQQNNC